MNEHLTPELFIDLLENTPVDSRWRQHLDACRECREELRGIDQALRIVREPERKTSLTRSRGGLYALAAAAVVALGIGLYAASALAPSAELDIDLGASGADAILPPLESDDDFAVLVALSAALPREGLLDAVEVGTGIHTPIDWELSDLDPAEREALLDQLALETGMQEKEMETETETETETRPGS